jgi:hypothetical protein
MMLEKKDRLHQLERTTLTTQKYNKSPKEFETRQLLTPRKKLRNEIPEERTHRHREKGVYLPPAKRGIMFHDDMGVALPPWLEEASKKPVKKSNYASLNSRARRMKTRSPPNLTWRVLDRKMQHPLLTPKEDTDVETNAPLDELHKMIRTFPDESTKTGMNRMTGLLKNAPRIWMSKEKSFLERKPEEHSYSLDKASDEEFILPELEPIPTTPEQDKLLEDLEGSGAQQPVEHGNPPDKEDEIASTHVPDVLTTMSTAEPREHAEGNIVCNRPYLLPSVDMDLLQQSLKSEPSDVPDTMPLKFEGDEEESGPCPIHVKFLQPPESPEELKECTIEKYFPPPPGFPVLEPGELLNNYWKMPLKKRPTARMHTGTNHQLPSTSGQLTIRAEDADRINNDPKLNMTPQVALERLDDETPGCDEIDNLRKESYMKLKRAVQRSADADLATQVSTDEENGY